MMIENDTNNYEEDDFESQYEHPPLPRSPLIAGFFKPLISPSFIITILIVFVIVAVLQGFASVFLQSYHNVSMVRGRHNPAALFILAWLIVVSHIAAEIFEQSLAGDNKLGGLCEVDFSISLKERIMNLFSWGARAMCAFFLAASPGGIFLAGSKIVTGLIGVELFQIPIFRNYGFYIILISEILFFPAFLLSSLSNDSGYDFWSKDVFRSVFRYRKIWSGFYFLSILIILAVWNFEAILNDLVSNSDLINRFTESGLVCYGKIVISSGRALLATFALFFYLRLLGKLGWIIEEKINHPDINP